MEQYTWHLLIIEDDEDDYLIVKEILSQAQQGAFHLKWASTFAEGRKALQGDPYDAVIVDYDLGIHKGTELIREAVANEYPAPMILLTGRGTLEIDVEAMKAGAADYLNKGEINANLLERTIRYAIERKRTEEKLRASEERYIDFLESTHDGFFAIDRDWCFIYLNGRVKEITRFDPGKLIGKNIWAEMPEMIGTPFEQFFRRAMNEGLPARFQAAGVYTGTWYDISVNPTRDGISVFFNDKTEEKKAELALQRAHAEVVNERNRLRAVMEALPVGVAIINPQGGHLMTNRSFDEIWGGSLPPTHSFDDLVAYKAWWADTGQPLEPEDWASARAVLRGETSIRQFLQIERFDGTRAYVLNSGAPVRDAQGQIVASAVAVMDITERIRVENALRESERTLKESDERFRVALSTLPMTVYIQDQDLRFKWVYHPREGLEPQQILGKRIDEIFSGESTTEIRALNQLVLNTGQGIQREMRVRFNGTDKYYLLSIGPLFDPSGKTTGLIGAALDVTEQRLIEMKHREAVTQMEIQRRLMENREQERQGIARDLHDGPLQDLSSLIFNVQFTKEESDDPGMQEELERIRLGLKDVVFNLRGVINELRPPALIRFGLSKSLQVYLENFKEEYPRIEFENTLTDDGYCLPEQVRLNLFRIVQEALSNAVHHAEATRIRVKFICTENEVVLEIGDNGIGFQVPENLVDDTLKGHFGLAGMKERAEAMGGIFQITSEPGQGTTVQVIVPVSR